MIKIWGTSFSLIGDLVISLPQLNYFKNKIVKLGTCDKFNINDIYDEFINYVKKAAKNGV